MFTLEILSNLMVRGIWAARTVFVTLTVTALVVVTILGERAALATLLNDEPTDTRATLDKLALLSELAMLSLSMMSPWVSGLVKVRSRVTYIAIAIAIGGASLALFIPV